MVELEFEYNCDIKIYVFNIVLLCCIVFEYGILMVINCFVDVCYLLWNGLG